METLNLLENKIVKPLEVIDVGKDFLNGTPIIQEITASINQWDYIRM